MKLSQAAPVLPLTKEEPKPETYGTTQPVSAATIPSVYNKKLGNIFRGRLVALPGETTVEQALKRMARFNITSVPVVGCNKEILGFVDMLDFVAYLVKCTGKEAGELDMETLKESSKTFSSTPICKLIDLSGRNPFYAMNQAESLADAVQEYLKGVHRIAITDDCGDLIGVISQWTIANYIATVPTDDKEWIPVMREPVGKVKYSSNVVSCNRKDTALSGFIKMYDNKLSALAVVDDEGKLVGNLSASDVKGYQLFMNNFLDLLQPVSEFLAMVRRKQGRPEDWVLVFTPDTLVKDIVTKINEEIVHRVYIIDKNRKPIGVFSLSDLLPQFVVDTHTTATFAKPTAMAQTSD